MLEDAARNILVWQLAMELRRVSMLVAYPVGGWVHKWDDRAGRTECWLTRKQQEVEAVTAEWDRVTCSMCLQRGG